MEATNEFLAGIPRSSDGKRRWPLELKAAKKERAIRGPRRRCPEPGHARVAD